MVASLLMPVMQGISPLKPYAHPTWLTGQWCQRHPHLHTHPSAFVSTHVALPPITIATAVHPLGPVICSKQAQRFTPKSPRLVTLIIQDTLRAIRPKSKTKHRTPFPPPGVLLPLLGSALSPGRAPRSCMSRSSPSVCHSFAVAETITSTSTSLLPAGLYEIH